MITASIVLYHTPTEEVKSIVSRLRQYPQMGDIWLIDNSESMTEALMFLPVTYIFNNKNLGYGTAHNIALRKVLEQNNSDYHLVINADTKFSIDTLNSIIDYMNANPDVAQVMPRVLYPDGREQHLAKLLPTPSDLITRRFLPNSWTKKRTAKFELHHLSKDRPYCIPCLSGCFMMLRTEALRNVGIFDERYFMYAEDIDLTRRLYQLYRTIYLPTTTIIHYHHRASYHSSHMLWVHVVNICRYFNKWGWFFDSQRTEINNFILDNIKK